MLARRLLRGTPTGRRDRRTARLGSAPRRRARCAGSRCAAQPAARRPAGRRPAARAARWPPRGTSTTCPRTPGRDTRASSPRRATGELGALLIGGVELADLPDPAAALAAVDAAPFVVSLELRHSAVTDRADVVLPRRAGRREGGHVRQLGGPACGRSPPRCHRPPRSDAGCSPRWPRSRRRSRSAATPRAVREELDGSGRGRASGRPAPTSAPIDRRSPAAGRRCWPAGDAAGRGPAAGRRAAPGRYRPAPVARLSAATAAEIGVADGEPVTVGSDARRRSRCRCEITDMPDASSGCR